VGALNGGWLSGQYRTGQAAPAASRALRQPDHFDWGGDPAQVKLALVEQLAGVAAEVGCSLPQLAIAFVLAHPAVTSAIIGPRTLAQLATILGASDVELDGHVLDRIDRIVPPG